MRARRFLSVLAVLALVATGCGDDDDETATTDTTEASEGAGDGEVTVQVDGKVDDPASFYLGYFPAEVTVRPGDTVVYKSNFTGEPHSITFGTLITPAIEAVENATPQQLQSEEPPPEFEPLLPYAMLPEGPGDANQVSANPCFVTTGVMPTDTTKPCDTREAAPFTGKEVFYNSGFLPAGEEYELKLADDIAPGTYKGFCMLHFTEMVSTITVVAEDADVPSADEVEQQGTEELEALTAKVKELHEKAKASVTDAGTVLAGNPLDQEEPSGPPQPNITFGLAEFTPREVSINSGGTVTFNINGPHSVTFNAPEDARVIIDKGPDGLTHLNEKAATPAVFNMPPPPEGPPPDGPPTPVDIGTFDGEAFANTGIQFGGSFRVRFSKAGTYEYICVVHPDMKGSVTVA